MSYKYSDWPLLFSSRIKWSCSDIIFLSQFMIETNAAVPIMFSAMTLIQIDITSVVFTILREFSVPQIECLLGWQ